MITVYKKPQCFACTKTIENLEATARPINVVDATEKPGELDYVKNDLGYLSASVVVASEHVQWTGLRPTDIKRVMAGGGTDDEISGN